MMTIRKDGYYISEPFHWVDSHAGHKFEGNTFYLIRFGEGKCIFDSVDDIKEIGSENGGKASRSDYSIDNNIIKIIHNPNTEFAVKRVFTIISPEILLDENLKEYTFHKL